jgi:hypothetical protein
MIIITDISAEKEKMTLKEFVQYLKNHMEFYTLEEETAYKQALEDEKH